MSPVPIDVSSIGVSPRCARHIIGKCRGLLSRIVRETDGERSTVGACPQASSEPRSSRILFLIARHYQKRSEDGDGETTFLVAFFGGIVGLLVLFLVGAGIWHLVFER